MHIKYILIKNILIKNCIFIVISFEQKCKGANFNDLQRINVTLVVKFVKIVITVIQL